VGASVRESGWPLFDVATAVMAGTPRADPVFPGPARRRAGSHDAREPGPPTMSRLISHPPASRMVMHPGFDSIDGHADRV